MNASIRMPVACLLLVGYAFYYYSKSKRLKTKASLLFAGMFADVIINLVADLIIEYMINRGGDLSQPFYHVSYFVFLFTLLNVSYLMFFHLLTYIEKGRGKKKLAEKCITIIMWVIGTLLLLTVPDASREVVFGSYIHSRQVYVMYVFSAYALILTIIELAGNWELLPKAKREVVRRSIVLYLMFAIGEFLVPDWMLSGLGVSMIVIGFMLSMEDIRQFTDVQTGYINAAGCKEMLGELLYRGRPFSILVYVFEPEASQRNEQLHRVNVITASYTGRMVTSMVSDHVLVFLPNFSRRGRADFLKERIYTQLAEGQNTRRGLKVLSITPQDTVRHIMEQIEQIHKEYEMEELHRDELTGLLLRTAFIQNVGEYLRAKKNFAMCVIDIDNFKGINDNYGHSMGDEMLRLLARVLRRALRKEDIICRMGGDEFFILLNDVSQKEEVLDIVYRINEELKTMIERRKLEFTMTLSIGARICRADHPATTFQELYETADQALYQAKNQGKNRCIVAE